MEDEASAALRHEMRVSGLRSDVLPSLEQVERRRLELWIVAGVALVGSVLGVVGLSMWSASALRQWVDTPVARIGAVLFALGMCAYLVEKETSLGRLSRLLMQERLLTTALTSRLEEIDALLEAGRAVNVALDLEQVFAAILRGAAQLLPAGAAAIQLRDGVELYVAAAVGGCYSPGARQPLDAGVAGRVLAEREPLLISSQPATGRRRLTVASAELTPKSSLWAPLIDAEELLGVLSVEAMPGNDFSAYDLRAVSLFAENAATAIVKARLLDSSRRQAEELSHRASHDPLTDTLNRRGLDEALISCLSAGEPTGLLYLDLDGFKRVNDRLGHPAGDQLLIDASRRIHSCIASGDLLARLGGDEFAVVLRGVGGPATAAGVGHRVLDRLAAPFAIGEERVRVSASIGVTVAVVADSPASLLERGDRAMYVAKAAGRGACALDTGSGASSWVVPQPLVAAGSATDLAVSP